MTLKKQYLKQIFFNAILIFISFLFALSLAEGLTRLKNSSMKNYDIEMWKYARELKKPSEISILGHEHIPSKRATLQSVDIRINERGMRGPSLTPADPKKRRILFLGSSVTLGWGVTENETVTYRLENLFLNDGKIVEVLNGGIGNYNTVRYTELFKRRLHDLNPTDIVIHYFVRDAEVLESGGGNFLLQHSQLAVLTWIVLNRNLNFKNKSSLEDHYLKVYSPDSEGFRAMRASLHDFVNYANNHNIRVYLAMTPDFHALDDYKLNFIHEIMRKISAEEKIIFIDLLPSVKNLTANQIWSMPGDPHPNGLGHKLMADAIYPSISSKHK